MKCTLIIFWRKRNVLDLINETYQKRENYIMSYFYSILDQTVPSVINTDIG